MTAFKVSMRSALAAAIKKQLELTSKADTDELRVALEDLAEDTATLYAKQLAGEATEIEAQAIKTRVALLKSASVLAGAEALRDALWQALVGPFQDATKELR